MAIGENIGRPEKGSAGGTLFASFVLSTFSVGPLLFYTFGLFIIPLSKAHGWARNDVILGASALSLGIVVGAPLVGALFDRFGVRRVLLPALGLFALGVLSLAGLDGRLWRFYATMGALGLIGTATLPEGFSRVITSWYEHPGRAYGWAISGSGVGMLLMQPFIIWLVTEWGPPAAYAALALVVGLVVLPIVYFGLHQRPIPAVRPAGVEGIARSFTGVLRDSAFLRIVGSFYLIGLGISAPSVTLAPRLIDLGLSAQNTAWVMSGFSVVAILSGIAAGLVVDRARAPLAITLLMAVPILGMGFFAFGNSVALTIVAAVFFGGGSGMFGVLAIFVANTYFDKASLSRDLGVLLSMTQLGSGSGPLVLSALQGASFRESHIFSLFIGLFCVATILLTTLGNKSREEVPAAAI